MKLGIALGGGGAKGLAHIPLLEVIDEFGLRPHCIAGTSIGAIIGVLYASGYRAEDIREGVNQISFMEGDRMPEVLKQKKLHKWFNYIDIDWGGNGLLKADNFLSDLMNDVKVCDFSELEIPLMVVAADFWKRRQRVFESGPIRPAIKASFALPGIFNPVVIDNNIYVDGGAVNPVPFDLLHDCDVVVAINVMGSRTESDKRIPSFSDAVFNTFQIMQNTVLQHKLDKHPPDIYIAPDIIDVRMLEFYKAEQVFRQAEPAKEQLRQELERLLGSHETII